MQRFEKAGMVDGYPSSGVVTFLGRQDCVGDTDQIVFVTFGLAAGTPPTEVDDAHRARGIVVGGIKTIAHNELRRTAAYVTLEKLIDGEATPYLTAPQKEDGLLPDSWEGWKDTVERTPKPTALSDGKSLLISPGRSPAFWDDAEPSPAFAYLRQVDNELIYVRPSINGSPACVAHTYRLP